MKKANFFLNQNCYDVGLSYILQKLITFYDFFLLCVRMCWLQFDLSENVFEQWTHFYGFPCVCVRIWVIKLSFCENDLKQR